MPKRPKTPAATATEVDQPIINPPFAEPQKHWHITPGNPPTQTKGRRRASYFYRVPERAGTGRGKRPQAELFESSKGQEIELELVNAIRAQVREWRNGTRSSGRPYDGVSPVTRELLDLWNSTERLQRLFFAQREAETVIFMTEASKIYHQNLPQVPLDEPGRQARARGIRALRRYACKMATGTGKTTVMAMLAAWSILNRVATPRDDRFSDTILIVCPNVTIRDRLAELDPARGDHSLYRTRQLVPPARMESLRRGEVMIANWHRLAKKETNTVNGDPARVIKTGEPTEIIKNPGKSNQSTETRYLESDAAWFKRIRRELGTGKGRSPHWLIFNDEAHHAYRRGNADIEQTLDDDKTLAQKNAREATIWIEGLDRINTLAGRRDRRGIKCCIDLSATPFYIQSSGNEVGKPFPWIISDFGLLDAIESGLVKIPQLAARDTTGADNAAYFNIWTWVQTLAKQDGRGTTITPEILLNYATKPINLLAQDWQNRFDAWHTAAKTRAQHPVPPVFIIICRDTAIARELHQWLACGTDRYGAAHPGFRNTPGQQDVTLRIDSKVIEDIEAGGTKDETKRLRFTLDTVGKTEWPGGIPPADYAALVRKHNDKLASTDNDGTLNWIDERIPPGRDLRCIVSVAMLAEGWDANTVTHIVGLRPFGSQLLCEQVVGRALRRKSYALNEQTGLFAEETATIFGVPFELIPFKVAPVGPQPPTPEPNHIYPVPERAEYEITFPIVTGYHETGTFHVTVDWDQVAQVTIDPMRIPDEAKLAPLTTPDGSDAAYGPGEQPLLTLDEWRACFRTQQVAFRLAREICNQWQADNGARAVPIQHLFPELVRTAHRFLIEKLDLRGNSQPCDILFIGEYMQAATDTLLNAVKKGANTTTAERPIIPQGTAGRGSTCNVDFHTTKSIHPATHCHLNAMVADTQKWEQSAAFVLDTHPGIQKWVKNDRLGFHIPYRHHGMPTKYIPDFIATTDSGTNVIIEIKGRVTDHADVKVKAAERWTGAINRDRQHGHWHYLFVIDPPRLAPMLDALCTANRHQPPVAPTAET